MERRNSWFLEKKESLELKIFYYPQYHAGKQIFNWHCYKNLFRKKATIEVSEFRKQVFKIIEFYIMEIFQKQEIPRVISMYIDITLIQVIIMYKRTIHKPPTFTHQVEREDHYPLIQITRKCCVIQNLFPTPRNTLKQLMLDSNWSIPMVRSYAIQFYPWNWVVF